MRQRTIFLAALLLAGCHGMPKSGHEQARDQWNAARAGAMAGLAADQLRDGNFDKCQATLDQVLRMKPDDANLHLLAAKLSIEQGKLELAEGHLAKSRQLDPKNAEADYYTGILMERWQQPARAQAAYADASAKDPAEAGYVLAEAEMLVALKKPSDALALLERSHGRFEHSGVLRQQIGLIQASLGRTDAALASFREACRLTPDDPTVREHLAFTLLSAKHFGEATDVLERLAKHAEYAKRADIFAAYGECLGRAKRFNEAQAAYDTAARLAPETPGYWTGLARTAMQNNDLPAADVAGRKAVALRPADVPTQLLVGTVRLKQSQWPQALNAFKAASDADPTDPTALCLQGYALAKSGRSAEAHACYTKALTLQPDSPLAGRLITMVGAD